jgi:eukaryotic-like serine/threonine-protein kinase
MSGGFGPKIGIRKGDVLAGKYRVDWILGTGSTGVVLAAYHLKLHERVAIKLLLPEALSNPEAVTRFEREARAAVKIKSEHVARIIDVGSLDGGAPFIVMEHLQGEDLAARIARTGPLSVEEAVDFMMQACEAIAEAHGLGIVHRDLKPANLFCVRGGDGQSTIKVLDFGISKVLDGSNFHTSGEMTKTSVVVGSPFYMSPEQMQAPRTVDPRTDIWSIGVILHELLSGNVPFSGETLPQIAVHVAKSQPPSLRLLRSDVPPGLESVILRCLEKSAKKRYRNVAELAAALGRYGPRKAALSSVDRIRLSFKNASERPFYVSVPPEGEIGGRAPTGTSPSWGAATTRTVDHRSRRNIAAAAVAVAAAGGALGFFLFRGETRSSPLALPGFASRAPFEEKKATGVDRGEPENTPPRRPAVSADDPSRAYAVNPAAPVLAMPPPTGTAQSTPPRGRDNRHVKSAPHPHVEAEPEGARGIAALPAAPGAAVKGEGTCLLNLASIPPATIVLDNKTIGASPKVSISVWAGSHTVVFRTADGVAKKVQVTCAPGDTKNVDVRLGDLPPAENAAEPCPLCERP